MMTTRKTLASTRDWATTYWTGKRQWVPHHTEPDTYVAPGGEQRTEAQLLNAGATKSTSYLWPRHWQQQRAPAMTTLMNTIREAS